MCSITIYSIGLTAHTDETVEKTGKNCILEF